MNVEMVVALLVDNENIELCKLYSRPRFNWLEVKSLVVASLRVSAGGRQRENASRLNLVHMVRDVSRDMS